MSPIASTAEIGVRGNGLVEFAVRGFDGGAPDPLSGVVARGRIPDEQAAIGAAELAAHVRDLLEAVDVLGLHEAQIVTQGRHALIERMPTMSATTPMQTAATTVFASRLRSPK
jgi:hypothetical protein